MMIAKEQAKYHEMKKLSYSSEPGPRLNIRKDVFS